jgi:1,4-alpha-glucan branching enzyme
MQGYLSIVLHAHLPFVRHPEHEQFLEENWLFEAITECYIPLLQVIEEWQRDKLFAPITLTLTPTLCSMLQDALLQDRYARRLEALIQFAEKEVQRTHLQGPFNRLALFYQRRLQAARQYYQGCGADLIGRFRKLQDAGAIEIITCAATHAVLPLLLSHPPSIRGQLLTARDHYRSCFGRDPLGIWLPECAYSPELDPFLAEAGLRWFVLDSHGLLNATPPVRYKIFAPIITPTGLAAFGRDLDSARQVWSKSQGYPGDPRYREFHRDIGFDLDFDYIRKLLFETDQRGFTGFKYFRVTGKDKDPEPYDPDSAMIAAADHAAHFISAREAQIKRIAPLIGRPPVLLCPYDAELFGHWWYEGPEFLDRLVRDGIQNRAAFQFITPSNYLNEHPTQQLATPSPSSWGEGGHWQVWLNDKNEWMHRELAVVQEQMSELVETVPATDKLAQRALRQAARELLLAQSSDWAFIVKTGSSPQYAENRVRDHLARFAALRQGLKEGSRDFPQLTEIEDRDNIFPELKPDYWRD